MNIIGLDVSANRIAWAEIKGGRLVLSDIVHRETPGHPHHLATMAASMILDLGRDPVFCLEINTRPKFIWNGKPSPNMINSYMRSRWLEGRLLEALGLQEPVRITRKRNGYEIPPRSNVYGLQAKNEGTRKGKDAKAERRRRMELLYPKSKGVSQDEIDALAIAHECSVALKMARAK